jgi:hypothetical protein
MKSADATQHLPNYNREILWPFLDLFARLDSEIVKAGDSVELTCAILRPFCANSRAVAGRIAAHGRTG